MSYKPGSTDPVSEQCVWKSFESLQVGFEEAATDVDDDLTQQHPLTRPRPIASVAPAFEAIAVDVVDAVAAVWFDARRVADDHLQPVATPLRLIAMVKLWRRL